MSKRFRGNELTVPKEAGPIRTKSARALLLWYTWHWKVPAGEMAEWLKAHAWKACLPQGNVGSNPTLSAIVFDPRLINLNKIVWPWLGRDL